MEDIRKETKAALELTNETMKKYYDWHWLPAHSYKVRDKVYVERTNITVDWPMSKLSDKCYGLFEILKKVDKAAYKLKLLARFKQLHLVFNKYLLTLHWPLAFTSQQEQVTTKNAEPKVDDNDPHPKYIVKTILGAKLIKNVLHYLVRWDGYNKEHNIWELVENLTNATAKVRDFYKKNPGAPCPLTNLAKKMHLRPLEYVTSFELAALLQPW